MEKEQFIKQVLPIRSKLLNYATSILGDRTEAEDVIQEVFMKLWYMHNELDKYDSVDALSFRMAKHLSLNKIKKSGREHVDLYLLESESDYVVPDDLLIEKEETNNVMLIIDQLPSLQQTILKMKHIEGLEVKEIAELTGSTVESIRMNLSRARKRVKDQFLKVK